MGGTCGLGQRRPCASVAMPRAIRVSVVRALGYSEWRRARRCAGAVGASGPASRRPLLGRATEPVCAAHVAATQPGQHMAQVVRRALPHSQSRRGRTCLAELGWPWGAYSQHRRAVPPSGAHSSCAACSAANAGCAMGRAVVCAGAALRGPLQRCHMVPR